MDTVLILQIVFLFAVFIICFLCVLLPVKIVPRDAQDISEKSQRILSFCNCFSGGVFLGTCFLQLIPFIEDKLNYTFFHYGVNLMYTCPVTQVLIILGFFMILIIEQLVRVCQRHDTHRGHQPLQLMVKPPADSASSDIESDESTGHGGNEKKHMLRRKKRKHRRSHHQQQVSHHLNESVGQLTEVTANGEQQEGELPNMTDARGQSDQRELSDPHEHSDLHLHSDRHGGSDLHGHSDLDRRSDTHGHGHSHLSDVLKQEFGLRCMLLMMALSIHSFFEGIALGLQDQLYKTVTLFIGIILHEILVSFAMGISLAKQKLQLVTTVKICVLYGATIPTGMAIGMAFHGFESLAAQLTSAIIQGLAAGTFVYVTFLEILPAEINQSKNGLFKVGFIFLGFAFMACLKFSLKEEKGAEAYYQPQVNVG